MPIIDQGYQHWSGNLSGHAWRWLAITRRGVKNALQVRMVRSMVFVGWIPALTLAFVLCMWGLVERQSAIVESIRPLLQSLLGQPILTGPRDYRVDIWTICFHYFLFYELWLVMILVLMVGPNLISQDLRYNALPLYLSRPLRRIDYFAGKLGIIVALVGMSIIVPAITAYVLGVLFSLDLSIIRDTFGILVGSVVYGLVVSVSAGLLMLALSSVSRNSRYVALLWIGIWLITGTVSLVLTTIQQERRMHEMGVRSRMRASDEFLKGEIAAGKTDWRPLISYTGNLQRIEERLLGVNAAWERLSQLSPPRVRTRILVRMLSFQYPWYWSAAVLVALAALSAIILSFAVKSLDKLK